MHPAKKNGCVCGPPKWRRPVAMGVRWRGSWARSQYICCNYSLDTCYAEKGRQPSVSVEINQSTTESHFCKTWILHSEINNVTCLIQFLWGLNTQNVKGVQQGLTHSWYTSNYTKKVHQDSLHILVISSGNITYKSQLQTSKFLTKEQDISERLIKIKWMFCKTLGSI